jgi:SAM-dependent methyltransferase
MIASTACSLHIDIARVSRADQGSSGVAASGPAHGAAKGEWLMKSNASQNGHMYDDLFYRYQREGSLRSARRVLPHVVRAATAASVLDVGCGAGAWLSVWSELGVRELQGVDGDYVDRSLLLFDPKQFIPLDIAQPFDRQRRFDLVMCLEVAEHVPPNSSDTLVANLVRHGDVVLFCAAAPGQGGENHVNEQPYEFWRDRFAAHGYLMYDAVRLALVGDEQIEPWYRYNLFLFAHQRGQHALAADVARTRIDGASPVADLSPWWYRLRKALLRQLPPSAVTRLAVWKHGRAVRASRTPAA